MVNFTHGLREVSVQRRFTHGLDFKIAMKRSQSTGSCCENPDWSRVHSSNFSSITSTESDFGNH